MRWRPHPCALELALVEEAKARRQESNCCRRPIPRPLECRRGARFVMVLKETGKLILIV
jgi:hypothetical protein